jgi:hypothetical protein
MTCEIDPGRRPLVDDIELDLEEPGFGTTIAVILTACAAISLAIFPAALALHAPGVPAGWAFAAGSLAAIIAIGKLTAIAWGAGWSLWSWHRASVAAAYAD